MPEVVLAMVKKDKEHANVYMLDGGLSAVHNYESLSDSEATFIGKLKTSSKMEQICSLMGDGTAKDLGKLELTSVS